ncbi:tRNA lysidine(34) synthetase TilS [Mesorhizobium sp.]|uniref:tRNA lysidine(34) synthetase TilS n=1 Tax=Mesorhizobium sp. TaxID=1871066 RepID=UPI000FE2B23F|nr:tRNA lysidine(34) synthetase TilS [Mesorhizobium sp.]RWA70161.1 MAG: tRNA lysidine(34) synthetase TilS [Mesorhizobium sp.]RWB99068.1 MAG: tRNA lysidine(34) synthetase TilS [Mesorhizobium sp.]RWG80660.1 MAG: tRNA lysidine(34) synthetase TilS [Mesorhizobium sp.]RWG86460.1 MAG: tRNA lysidine(34) synthetase TilS [Mesorhizobium sp.]RWK04579.1 MAG: tRNA lysidine(34) synthetase TilS [Mesorhizobium sp.]
MLDTEPDLSDRLFSDYDFSNGAVAAVSGGSDSTALLFLLKHYLDRILPAARLLAVTIDHDLRPGSAAEAQAVARLCAENGIAHRTLVWSGPKPSTSVPAAAREARYRLLAEAAKAEGIRLVLTGHTADDQAETVLMRQARNEAARDGEAGDEGAREGIRGLAGMAPATLHDWRTWIGRPLLGTRRAALRDMLKRRGIGWIEDPTNVDQRFERPRLRITLAGGDGEARFAQAIAKAGQAAAEREELGRRAAALIGTFASRPASGLIRLDRDFATGEDHETAVYALRILLATIGGVSFLVDEARCRALYRRLRSETLCATLSRTVVDARRTGIFLYREARNLPAVPAENQALWDGRRRITLSDRSGGLVIAPVGSAAAKRFAQEGDVPASVLRRALAAEPALWRGGERLDFADGGTAPPPMATVAVVSPFARFLPSFDLEPAAAVAALIGAPPLPPLPFRGHDRDGAWAKA